MITKIQNPDLHRERIEQIRRYEQYKKLILSLQNQKVENWHSTALSIIFKTKTYLSQFQFMCFFSLFTEKTNLEVYYLELVINILEKYLNNSDLFSKKQSSKKQSSKKQSSKKQSSKKQSSKKQSSQKFTNSIEDIFNICQIILNCLTEQVLTYLTDAKPIIFYSSQQIKDYISKITENIKRILQKLQAQVKCGELEPRSQKFLLLFKKIAQLIPKAAGRQFSAATYKTQYVLCTAEIIKIQPKNIFQEITLNRFKEIIERPIKKLIQNCCKVFIQNTDKYYILEEQHYEHKNYHWPVQLASIIKHVKKTIVGFLNHEGGIIYVGMKESKSQIEPTGIGLSRKQTVEFFQWVRSMWDDIYPEFQQYQKNLYEIEYNRSLQNLAQKQKKEQLSEYIINKYTSLEYIPLIDSQTYLDIYEAKQQVYRKCYIVKIKIKAGTKAQTYHLLTDEKESSIEGYMRQDDHVKKLNQEQFFDLYYKRLSEYMNEKIIKDQTSTECPLIHFQCSNKNN